LLRPLDVKRFSLAMLSQHAIGAILPAMRDFASHHRHESPFPAASVSRFAPLRKGTTGTGMRLRLRRARMPERQLYDLNG
jgi:hypothetical protein